MTKSIKKNVKLNVRISKELRDKFNSLCKRDKTTISKQIILFIKGKINGKENL
jgi:hypothetical protein